MTTTERAGWLADALFAAGSGASFVPVPSDAGPHAHTWLARPDAAAAELLVPERPRSAARAVARRYSDASSGWDRLRSLVAEVALGTGLAQRAWTERVTLDIDPEVWVDPERSLIARLGVELGAEVGSVAITLGPVRENRKPVLQLFDDAGRPFAFAKVAVDDRTERLVATEGEWLSRVGQATRNRLVVPSLRACFRWQQRTVVVADHLRLPRFGRRQAPPPGLIREIAGIVPLTQVDAARAPSLSAAAEEARHEPVAAEPPFVVTVDRWAERLEGTVEVGAWHGDLTPWNMATDRRRTQVWDWEYAGEGMPVGADAIHHHVMARTHIDGESAPTAIRHLMDEPIRLLGGLGLTEAGARAVVALWLIEVARRERAQRRRGGIPAPLGVGAAARAWLDAAVGNGGHP